MSSHVMSCCMRCDAGEKDAKEKSTSAAAESKKEKEAMGQSAAARGPAEMLGARASPEKMSYARLLVLYCAVMCVCCRERDGAGLPPHDGLPVPDGHRGGPHPQVQQSLRVRVPRLLRRPPDACARHTTTCLCSCSCSPRCTAIVVPYTLVYSMSCSLSAN